MVVVYWYFWGSMAGIVSGFVQSQKSQTELALEMKGNGQGAEKDMSDGVKPR